MKKMMNPELEVVRFGAEDVIATSGAPYSINHQGITHDCTTAQDHYLLKNYGLGGYFIKFYHYDDTGTFLSALDYANGYGPMPSFYEASDYTGGDRTGNWYIKIGDNEYSYHDHLSN